jgi:hypothetical protein
MFFFDSVASSSGVRSPKLRASEAAGRSGGSQIVEPRRAAFGPKIAGRRASAGRFGTWRLVFAFLTLTMAVPGAGRDAWAQITGPSGPGAGGASPPRAEPPRPVEPPDRPELSKSPHERLDVLFKRLAEAEDAVEAGGVAGRIQRVWGRSSSDVANLLMARAMFALHRDERALAEDLLDRLLTFDPDWAEAWARRAGLRLQHDDVSGAAADLSEALRREPRHYGALSSLGFLLLRLDRKPEALRAFRAALAIHPFHEPTKTAAAKLERELAGRDL